MQAHPAGASEVRLEQIIDRMLVRRPSKRASRRGGKWKADDAASLYDFAA